MIDIQIIETPLSIQQCLEAVQNHAAGGSAVFVGTVRNQTQGKQSSG